MQYDQSVPAYLRDQSLIEGQEAFTGGIGGARGPHATFRNGFFFLVQSDGTEKQVPTPYLDFVLVDAAPGLSKLYYEGAYVPGSSTPPTCFSNDGKFPDQSVAEPPHENCAGCPMNVFGSVTTQLGKPAKACSDRKRIALLYVYDIKGPLYEMSISPSNLRPWNEYLSQLTGRGVPPRGIVHRMSPNPSAQGGVLFQAAIALNGVGIWYIPEPVVPLIAQARASDECRKAIGLTGETQRALAAPAPQQYIAAPTVNPVPTQPPVQQWTPPAPAPIAPAPVADPFGQQFAQQPASAGGVATTASESAGKRPRRTKAEMEAARAATTNPQSASQPQNASGAAPAPVAATPFVQPAAHLIADPMFGGMNADAQPGGFATPAGSGAFGIVTNPAPVPAELDAMLAQVMGQPQS